MFTIIRGTDFTFNVTVTQDSVAVDITGYTLYFTAKKQFSDADADAEISKTILPAQLTDPTHGITAITLSNSETDINEGKYKFDITILTTDDTIIKMPPDEINIQRAVRQSIT